MGNGILREKNRRSARISAFWLAVVFVAVFLNVRMVKADYWDEATPINTNVEKTDNLTDVIREKYYAFELENNGVVSVSFNHSLINQSKTYYTMSVYNREYELLVYTEFVGDIASGETPQLGLPKGKYYVCIRSGYEFTDKIYSFTVHYQKAENWEKEFNENYMTATKLTLGSAVSGSIRERNDYDYYSFEPSQKGYIQIIFSHPKIDFPDTYWNIALFDEEYNLMTSWDIPGNQETFTVAPIGISKKKYYLRILDGYEISSLTYTLKVSFTPSTVWEMERNENRETATPVIINTEFAGNTMDAGDYDYYTFTLAGEELMNLTFTHADLGASDSYWSGSLYDSGYSLIWSKDFAGDAAAVTTPLGNLKAGKYYFSITSGYIQSDITYKFRFTPSPKEKGSQSISVSSRKKVFGAKPFSLNAKLTAGNGTLKYVSANKKVAAVSANGLVTIKGIGKTTITVTAAETTSYKAASKKVTVTVLPRTAAVKSLRNAKKGKLTITWKKDKTVSGYIIQYATNKKFKNAKTVTVKGKNKTSKTISVKKGKTYYVRLRTYKDNLKSSWGKAKKIKIVR